MKTEVLTIDPAAGRADLVGRAAEALARGRLVVFPTETVYGIAANAALGDSVDRLRELKGRGVQHPFTVHVGRRSDVDEFVPEMSSLGRRMIRKGWPGPITLLFKLEDVTRTPVYGRLSPQGVEAVFREHMIGLRCPDEPIAADLLAAAKAPIIASSANLAGKSPPITAEEALAELDGVVDLVLNGGRTRYGKPSTIVALNGSGFTIQRVGVFDERTIRRIANFTILFVCTGNTCRSPMAAALARRMLAEKWGCTDDALADRGLTILSAGTHASAGIRVSPEAVEVCRRRGADIGPHRSEPLSAEMIRSADQILAMTRGHIECILQMVPEAADKVLPLDPVGDIADPIGGSMEEYEACGRHLAAALETSLEKVTP